MRNRKNAYNAPVKRIPPRVVSQYMEKGFIVKVLEPADADGSHEITDVVQMSNTLYGSIRGDKVA